MKRSEVDASPLCLRFAVCAKNSIKKNLRHLEKECTTLLHFSDRIVGMSVCPQTTVRYLCNHPYTVSVIGSKFNDSVHLPHTRPYVELTPNYTHN